MRIGVPRSDTAFLQRECAVVSEQVSIMEETIGKAENRVFAHARRLEKTTSSLQLVFTQFKRYLRLGMMLGWVKSYYFYIFGT